LCEYSNIFDIKLQNFHLINVIIKIALIFFCNIKIGADFLEIFVARQPILNLNEEVFGYELLYRSSLNNCYDFNDGDKATNEVINNSFLLMGIESLTEGKKAFINCTANLLKNEALTVLPSNFVALEILENIKIDDEVVEACKRLKKLGYTMVLDDFNFADSPNPLVELADIIKVDFLKTTAKEQRLIIDTLKHNKVKFLAEKVETRQAFEEAKAMGYTLFQGYFFSKPMIVTGKDISGSKTNYFQILEELNKTEADFDTIENIIKQDVAISYKLLKFVNSSAFYFNNRIESIKQALVVLGLAELKKWLSLIIFRDLGENKPEELLKISIIRARFSEVLARKIGLSQRSSACFLAGMFSTIDALLDQSMDVVLANLPISDEIRKVLLGEESPLLDLYKFTIAYEKGEWELLTELSEKLGLNNSDVPGLFIESVRWAYKVCDE